MDHDASSQSDEDDPMRPYLHLPLSSRGSIRLLKLLPAKARDPKITCILEEHNFKEKSVEFEALSWSWGVDAWDARIIIRRNNEDFYFNVPQSLLSCLTALRSRRAYKLIWVDAICINQDQMFEKNHQIPMMPEIYGRARRVDIWIGDADTDSKTAIDFIKNEILRLQHFDELFDDPQSTTKWVALGNLLTRPWFSRRWVIQEIVLAKEAMIYCGKESIMWNDFADAVQLFVKVETATRKVSEVMKKDPKFYRVPNWFDYVSALGASHLVETTTSLFRITKHRTRQPVPSLEYLVSKLSTFDCSEPRDTIYALVAIARDTNPIAIEDIHERSPLPDRPWTAQLMAWANRHISAKRYPVDYSQSYVDVCREFISFSIQQSFVSNPAAALDVICRPWAQIPPRPKTLQTTEVLTFQGPLPMFPSWIPQLSSAPYAMFVHPDGTRKMGRKNADPLVGLPYPSQRSYSAAATRPVNMEALRFKKRSTHYSMYVSGFVLDQVSVVHVASQAGNIPEEWFKAGGWDNINDDPPEKFWRTLVADRGDDGLDPPGFFLRACKEAAGRGLPSGSLNTSELINQGRSSIISDFLRRVQSVIWNRSLMTTESGTLGIVQKHVLPGDLICILYGCSVPVIFRQHEKSALDLEQENQDDETESKIEAAMRIQRWWRFKKKGEREFEWVHVDAFPQPRTEIKKGDEDREFWYEFIGECYVHGMMDGDAITYQHAHRHKARVFELR
jgi:hypothetical protein